MMRNLNRNQDESMDFDELNHHNDSSRVGLVGGYTQSYRSNNYND